MAYIPIPFCNELDYQDSKVEANCEPVNFENIQNLMKNIARPKAYGNLAVYPYGGQGKIRLGRWLPVKGDLILCDELSETEQAEAQQILQDMGVWFIQNDIVFYRNDECPKHFTVYGTGDCNCIPSWQE